MRLDNNQRAFFALVKAGLWEKDVRLLPFGGIDFNIVYRLAEEQSVIGLVAAGLEHVIDFKAPQEVVLQFVGQTLQLEQRNKSMNEFIGHLYNKLDRERIHAILLKGQGVAQCYERPLWRVCGDVDLLLDKTNYEKAKDYLVPIASAVEEEDCGRLHLGMNIDPWVVELHGTLHGYLWQRAEALIDDVIYDTINTDNVRLWGDCAVNVKLPAQDNDVVIVFTHILQHFFTGGIGIRQLCDWCRLLWTFRDKIDLVLLKERLQKAGILNEWQAFAALAVETLGMPAEAMPFYSPSRRWSRKAEKALAFVLETGNFGHNRDVSYYQKYPYLVYKTISLCRNTRDSMRHLVIFPLGATKVWWSRTKEGIRSVMKGK